MQSKLNAYINFKRDTRAAMEFYHSILGGKLTMSTFKEFNAAQDPDEENLIMHSMLETDNGMTLMASDTPNRMEFRTGTNFGLSLSGDNEAELTTFFQKLSAGGTITMPLEKAIWGDSFGMFTDKFGVSWMVNITSPRP